MDTCYEQLGYASGIFGDLMMCYAMFGLPEIRDQVLSNGTSHVSLADKLSPYIQSNVCPRPSLRLQLILAHPTSSMAFTRAISMVVLTLSLLLNGANTFFLYVAHGSTDTAYVWQPKPGYLDR